MSAILNRTPSANLTGTISQAEDTTGNVTTKRTGTTFGATATVKAIATSSGTNETSVVVTTPADSLVVIAYSCEFAVGSTGTFNMRILDGSTTLQTKSAAHTATKYQLFNGLFVGIPNSGSRTYNIQCWGPSGSGLLEVSIFVSHVQFTDTHDAVGKPVNQVIKG